MNISENLHTLNLKIKELEETVFNRKEQELRMKKTKDIVLLQLTNDLEQKYIETKDKKLSSIEKRINEAEKNADIQKHIKDMELYRHTTAMLEIELNYNKRLFEILLKTGE